MNTESNARQAGLQTNRLPGERETVLVRTEAEHYARLWPGYHDGKKWRWANGLEIECAVIGWIEINDAAHHIDSIGNPSDS